MKQYRYFQPLYRSSKEDGEKIISEAKLPVWSGYAKEIQRTACGVCPGQSQITYAAIRRHYPKVWAVLKSYEKKFGPGCWSDPKNMAQGKLEELADRGDARRAKQL